MSQMASEGFEEILVGDFLLLIESHEMLLNVVGHFDFRQLFLYWFNFYWRRD